MSKRVTPQADDVTRLAAMAGLEIDPAHLPGVLANLQILHRQAGLFLEPAIDPIVEPAGVYRP